MEDILASIKRIIADDGSAALAAPRVRGGRPVAVPAPEPMDEDDRPGGTLSAPAAAPQAEVLELTEAVPAPPEPEAAEPEAAQTAAPEPEPLAASAPPPAEVPSADRAPAAIVSEDAATASRQSLAALSALVVQPDSEAPANTLEGLVREMLKPMLKEWLDARLPEVVEKLVAKEIARISGRL